MPNGASSTQPRRIDELAQALSAASAPIALGADRPLEQPCPQRPDAAARAAAAPRRPTARPAAPSRLASRSRSRRRAMSSSPQRDDNPCRPRHFKPGPCAPAPHEGPAKQSLETSRTRLIIAGALFGLAFVVIARAPRRGRRLQGRRHRASRTSAAPTQRRDQPRRHRRPQRRAAGDDADDAVALRQSQDRSSDRQRGAARSSSSVLPDLNEARSLCQAHLRQELRLAEAPIDAAPGCRRQPRSASPACNSRTKSAASIPRATSRPCRRLCRHRQQRPRRDRARLR